MIKPLTFKDLIAWQKGHEFVIRIYELTKTFPKEELYVLTSQMRRSAISITSNIAEGFSRKSHKEKIQFYTIARGSLTEIENQLLIARDIGYIKKEHFDLIINSLTDIHKLINGLIKSLSVPKS